MGLKDVDRVMSEIQERLQYLDRAKITQVKVTAVVKGRNNFEKIVIDFEYAGQLKVDYKKP